MALSLPLYRFWVMFLSELNPRTRESPNTEQVKGLVIREGLHNLHRARATFKWKCPSPICSRGAPLREPTPLSPADFQEAASPSPLKSPAHLGRSEDLRCWHWQSSPYHPGCRIAHPQTAKTVNEPRPGPVATRTRCTPWHRGKGWDKT